jgi:hypothetical protein
VSDWEDRVQAGRDQAEAIFSGIPVPPAITSQPNSGDLYHGITNTADLQQAIYQTRARELVRVTEVIRPGTGQADAFDRETLYRQQWMRTVGRPFSAQELRGTLAGGCADCARLAGMVCDLPEDLTESTRSPCARAPRGRCLMAGTYRAGSRNCSTVPVWDLPAMIVEWCMARGGAEKRSGS